MGLSTENQEMTVIEKGRDGSKEGGGGVPLRVGGCVGPKGGGGAVGGPPP